MSYIVDIVDSNLSNKRAMGKTVLMDYIKEELL